MNLFGHRPSGRWTALWFLLLAFSISCLTLAFGGETAQFLKLGAGARALGMGGAYGAVADDASALYWNPAGLAAMTRRELGAMRSELAAGTRYDFLGYAHPTPYGTLAFGTFRLTQRPLEGRDASGRPTGGFQAADEAFSLAYAASLIPGTRLGASLKYIRSSIAGAGAQGFAADLGGQREIGPAGPGDLNVSLAAQNLGPGLRLAEETQPLPLALSAGLGYHLPIGLTVSADFRQRPHAGTSALNVGTEYALSPSLALRAGYGVTNTFPNNAGPDSSGALGGLAAGFGVNIFALGLQMDYSAAPFPAAGGLGAAQRLSLTIRL